MARAARSPRRSFRILPSRVSGLADLSVVGTWSMVIVQDRRPRGLSLTPGAPLDNAIAHNRLRHRCQGETLAFGTCRRRPGDRHAARADLHVKQPTSESDHAHSDHAHRETPCPTASR